MPRDVDESFSESLPPSRVFSRFNFENAEDLLLLCLDKRVISMDVVAIQRWAVARSLSHVDVPIASFRHLDRSDLARSWW